MCGNNGEEAAAQRKQGRLGAPWRPCSCMRRAMQSQTRRPGRWHGHSWRAVWIVGQLRNWKGTLRCRMLCLQLQPHSAPSMPLPGHWSAGGRTTISRRIFDPRLAMPLASEYLTHSARPAHRGYLPRMRLCTLKRGETTAAAYATIGHESRGRPDRTEYPFCSYVKKSELRTLVPRSTRSAQPRAALLGVSTFSKHLVVLSGGGARWCQGSSNAWGFRVRGSPPGTPSRGACQALAALAARVSRT